MIDFTRYAGPKIGGSLNKLLDDKQSEYLGIKMDTPFTRVLVLLICGAAFVGGYRVIFGLGASTNMNDYWPWGLWIAFDVLGGVAMAAGAFMIAGAVYILNMKKYKCIARASILNAFFGYLLAAISITFDVGRSAVIWHPLIMWQINSVMFIVALHLVLYLSTLATESSPMVFEKLGWQRALKFVHRIMVGAVMFGVALSLLFVGRMLYRFWSLHEAVAHNQPPLFQSPLTFFIFGLVAGYYLVFQTGVLRHARTAR